MARRFFLAFAATARSSICAITFLVVGTGSGPRPRQGQPLARSSRCRGQCHADQPGVAFQQLDLPGASEHWQTVLDLGDVPDLEDHALCGYPLFAAAGYLALVLDLLKDQRHPLQFDGFSLDRPLWLNSGAVQLQAVRDGAAFSFYSRGVQAEDAKTWQLHGQLCLTKVSQHDIEPLETFGFDDSPRLEVSTFYRSLRELGLDYGGCYQPIVALQANATGAEAVLHRPDAAPDRCLIDGCFQLVAAVLAQTQADGQLLLPVGLEHIQMLQWPLPDQLRCRLKLRPEHPNRGDENTRAHVTADLDLLDLSGTLLGGIRGLQLRRLTRTLLELMLPEVPSHSAIQLLEDVWQPIPAMGCDWNPAASEPITLIALGQLPMP